MKSRGSVLSRRIAHAATVADWASLEAGERIEVVKHAQVIAAGEVQEVSVSGNVVWLEPAGPGADAAAKQLFMKSDGVVLRRA
ncbi:hypothetical protein BIU82_03390 [Arthrobacter sp. SW1]|uniref:hypothetical protein n=1 Tax=Arthrobacter sp. SW1 TaxID=1920889 RepID=UPI000877DD52|nr:hypothetical protein [Arthrobacter sp. SW1]OFI38393.1 hypothetical protein BIU82_03390 [Arthrobacter sp. SW1]